MANGSILNRKFIDQAAKMPKTKHSDNGSKRIFIETTETKFDIKWNEGGLFSEGEEEQELMFRIAAERINSDPTILPRSTLVAQVEKIGREDSFHANKKVCGLLKNGVAGIFGPLSGMTSEHVQSICDALEIPHVETRSDFESSRDELSINLYPRPSVLARAFMDLVKAWNWRHFAIVYEENEGITGSVSFDQLGFRSGFTLDVMTLNEEDLQKIGVWTEKDNKGLNINKKWLHHYEKLALENKTLIVTTILNEPYTMLKQSGSKKDGNERYEGYAVDLIYELSKLLHFRYNFTEVKDKAYGSQNETSGEWNGMIGEVKRGEADLAIADLTITSKREKAVDFTLPFMNTGISILFRKPTTKVTTLFSFLSPFSMVVWVYVVGAYVGVSVILFVVGRLSPYEWDNPHPCRQDDQVLENDFSLLNSFWFTIGSLMQQGSDLAPKSMSTRTIAGSTCGFFRESKIPTYSNMWKFMASRQNVFASSNAEGKKRVLQGNYAFLMESASIEYTIERECNLTQIGGLLDSKGYGIATPKDSPYLRPLSQAILKLQESGVLHQLKDRWWKQKRGGGACADDAKKASSSVTELSLGNVGGVFVVLLGGIAAALIMALFEFMWRARKVAPDRVN
ncbi:hypothetical protein RND71_043892 [Anisodus tanguticus]|uniref:Uncharacterized protein n=1 Tax=Anisodus tanguticus TaxID=243964 RepID=A0AAE1UM94_9SOLA|nr:hypothetical protein RND71_043892 [Anisodus tanguticus]